MNAHVGTGDLARPTGQVYAPSTLPLISTLASYFFLGEDAD
jgi:hypothetical protein